MPFFPALCYRHKLSVRFVTATNSLYIITVVEILYFFTATKSLCILLPSHLSVHCHLHKVSVIFFLATKVLCILIHRIKVSVHFYRHDVSGHSITTTKKFLYILLPALIICTSIFVTTINSLYILLLSPQVLCTFCHRHKVYVHFDTASTKSLCILLRPQVFYTLFYRRKASGCFTTTKCL